MPRDHLQTARSTTGCSGFGEAGGSGAWTSARCRWRQAVQYDRVPQRGVPGSLGRSSRVRPRLRRRRTVPDGSWTKRGMSPGITKAEPSSVIYAGSASLTCCSSSRIWRAQHGLGRSQLFHSARCAKVGAYRLNGQRQHAYNCGGLRCRTPAAVRALLDRFGDRPFEGPQRSCGWRAVRAWRVLKAWWRDRPNRVAGFPGRAMPATGASIRAVSASGIPISSRTRTEEARSLRARAAPPSASSTALLVVAFATRSLLRAGARLDSPAADTARSATGGVLPVSPPAVTDHRIRRGEPA